MHGQYRDSEWAQVTDGNNSIPIPRDQYEAQGYEPPFDDLPAREAFELGNA